MSHIKNHILLNFQILMKNIYIILLEVYLKEMVILDILKQILFVELVRVQLNF